MTARIHALSFNAKHAASKGPVDSLRLRAGLGVEGDAHAGKSVQHRSRVELEPDQPNLRQVHLIHLELLEELRAKGFELEPGCMGENVMTEGIDLLGLPTGARLELGEDVVLAVTGLRNPCAQLDAVQPGLMSAVVHRDDAGRLVRRAGIMTIVLEGGEIRRGDAIRITLPAEPHRPLEPV
jgi:MOSC domain-containing protein YiiM